MPDKQPLLILLLLGCIVLPCSAIAQDNENAPEDEYCPGPIISVQEEEQSFFDFLNKPQKNISTGLEWLTKRIDTFFADEDIYEESTGSYIRISGSSILREGGQQSFLGDLNIRLELPRTKKKLKLIIETDADQNLENRPDQQGQTTPNQTLSNTTYYAGLEKELAEKSLWDIRTSTGIKIRSPLDPFLRLRMSREVLFDTWKLRFTETLFHFHSTGSGHTTSLEIDHPTSKTDLVRMRTSATWWDNTDHYELSHTFTFFHEITDRRVLSYGIGVYGTNKPALQADTYLLDIRYRQRLHKDWLYAEINPQVLYLKTGNFEPEHSLTLKLEMIFGEVHF